MNHNNRHELAVSVAATANKTIPLVKAHKKLSVAHLSLITGATIAASSENYVTVKVMKKPVEGSAVELAEVDTQEGLTALEELQLSATEILLEKGELLYLDITKAGTGSIEGLVDGDLLVRGN